MNSSTWFGLALLGYLLSTAVYFLYLSAPRPPVARFARRLLAGGLIAQLIGLGLRWYQSYELGYGHAPVSNMYESMLLFAACSAGVSLLLEWRHRMPAVGALCAPVAAIVLAYTSLSSSMSNDIEPLFPALKSNWLTAHVLVCFIAYAAFAASAVLSAAYLWKLRTGDRGFARVLPPATVLDEVAYQAVGLGFPMLTMGIFFGAVWANVAWGTYWSWDPKETWSLVTWLVYATYLHARLVRGWRGPKAALLSILGFAAVLFTYFGVNYLLSGLHSYA